MMSPAQNVATALKRTEDELPSDGRQYTPGHSDGLGDRGTRVDDQTKASIEMLRIKPEFANAPGFEKALRASVEAIGRLHESSLTKVYEVGRFGPDRALTLVSTRPDGQRLAELIPGARGTALAVTLVQEMGPALAALHLSGQVHGALTPERIVISSEGRPTIVEHVLGAAIASLALPGHRLRAVTGVAVPDLADRNTIEPRLDVIQLGVIVLSLLLGQRLEPSAYPSRMIEQLNRFSRTAPDVAAQFRPWLERALQIHDRPFATALDALAAFEGLSEALPPEPIAEVPAVQQSAPTTDVPTPDVPDAPAPTPDAVPEPPDGKRVVGWSGPVASRPETPTSGSGGSGFRLAALVLGLLVVVQAAVIGYMYVDRLPAEAPVVMVAGPGLAPTPALIPSPPVVQTPEPPAPDSTPDAAAAPVAARVGGVTLTAPIDLQVYRDGELLGSTGSPIAMAAGTHALEVVNETFGYRAQQRVVVQPGQMAAITVALPDGRLSINAAPWAEVLIDGVAAGETPLANLSLTIGEHEIVFRHPQFDEQRQTAVVNVDGVTRVSAVFRQ